MTYSRKKNAFTLVELLVVIAIISLLAGLLLPALSKAQNFARSTACVSRMRQLALASLEYQEMFNVILTDDFSIPYAQAPTPTDYKGIQLLHLAGIAPREWIGANYYTFSSGGYGPVDPNSVRPAWVNGYLRNNSYALCPNGVYTGYLYGGKEWTGISNAYAKPVTAYEAARKDSEMYAFPLYTPSFLPSTRFSTYSSYTGNAELIDYKIEGSNTWLKPHHNPRRPGNLKRSPSKVFQWFEGYHNWATYISYYRVNYLMGSGIYTGGNRYARHGDANFSALDGHVGTIPQIFFERMQAQTVATANSAQYNLIRNALWDDYGMIFNDRDEF